MATMSNDTSDRLKGDKTATRNDPVHWIGTSTSRWEEDASDEGNPERRRRHNFNVSSPHRWSEEEEEPRGSNRLCVFIVESWT